jgi:hypothetical protein
MLPGRYPQVEDTQQLLPEIGPGTELDIIARSVNSIAIVDGAKGIPIHTMTWSSNIPQRGVNTPTSLR